ncbi:MAG: alpha/beta hydrolase [Chitinophagaceae bacterium]|nr:MAG: alpha/beta hydrolase [Chitinophagaceae bacterium]
MSKQIYHKTALVNDVRIFYREAGDSNNPALLLLHGFPTSSIMFKNLMTVFADKYYLIAPDYPGFGFSDFPGMNQFEYSFDNIAHYINRFAETINLKFFTIYLHDYGCPIGLRICMQNPEKIQGLIVQNGNAYIEGIGAQWNETRDYWEHPTPEKEQKVSAFLSKEGTQMQYTAGLPQEMLCRVSPESWLIDWERMSRPGNVDMQFHLNCDYQSNLALYPRFQEYFRSYQPPAVVIRGKYDAFFDVAEAHCYSRHLPKTEVHILEGGHMVLETNFDDVVEIISTFMTRIKLNIS